MKGQQSKKWQEMTTTLQKQQPNISQYVSMLNPKVIHFKIGESCENVAKCQHKMVNTKKNKGKKIAKSWETVA